MTERFPAKPEANLSRAGCGTQVPGRLALDREIEDRRVDAGFGNMPSPCMILRLDEIAEAYFDLPVLSIVQYLIQVDRETEHVAQEDTRRVMATRMAMEGLEELAAQDQGS